MLLIVGRPIDRANAPAGLARDQTAGIAMMGR